MLVSICSPICLNKRNSRLKKMISNHTGVMDCKEALAASGNDLQGAMAWLLQRAKQKASPTNLSSCNYNLPSETLRISDVKESRQTCHRGSCLSGHFPRSTHGLVHRGKHKQHLLCSLTTQEQSLLAYQ